MEVQTTPFTPALPIDWLDPRADAELVVQWTAEHNAAKAADERVKRLLREGAL